MAGRRINRLVRAMEAAYKDQDKELRRIVSVNTSTITDLNKQQLFSGVDANNRKLAPYRSKWYAAFKKILNPLGVTDLYLHGKFYNGFFVKRIDFPITIDSRDSKRDKLVEKYGQQIFGLNTESKKIFAHQHIKQGLISYYKKVLRIR